MKTNFLERLNKMNEAEEARKEKARERAEARRMKKVRLLRSIKNEWKREILKTVLQYVDFNNEEDQDLEAFEKKIASALGAIKNVKEDEIFEDEDDSENDNNEMDF